MSRRLLLGTLGALFVAGDYWFFRRVIIYFNALPMNVGEILIVQLLNLLCLTLFSMLVFSNIITSISTLYMSRDLDLLISSPIPTHDIFLSKFFATLINSSWMAVLFGAPIFIAYGQVYHASWGYYAVLPVAIMPFLLAPSGLGVLFTMTLMRFFPARRTHQIMTFIGLIFIAGLVMFFRFLQPEKFLGKDVPEERIIQFVEKLKAPDYPWLPSSMMTKSLQAGAFGDWTVFMNEQRTLWIAAVALVAVTVVVATWFYYSGWASAHGARTVMMPKKEKYFYSVVRRAVSVFSPDIRALVMKDLKLFWRDTGQWSQLFMLGALVVVYIFNIRNLPLDTIYLKNVVSVMNIGLAGVVLAAVAARFVFGAVSVEGRSFWTVHSSPVDFRRYLWAKFLLYILPLLLLAEILVVVSNWFLAVDGFVMAVSAGAIAALTVGLTGLGVGMGAMYPKFDFENVAEVGATAGAIMYMIISLGFVGLSVSLIAGPVHMRLRHVFFLVPMDWGSALASFAALGVITAVFVYAPLKLGVEALNKLEA